MYEIINEEQQLKDFDYKKITPESLGLKATNDFALYANEKIVNEMPEESQQWVSKGPIGVLEAGQMYADEMNEFDGTYANIKPEKEQGAWSNSVDERIARNFEKKEQRDKRIKEGNGSFFDKVGAFMDKVGDDSLKAQKEQAQKVQDRQMLNKDNANYKYEFKSIDKAGQPIFVERNLNEKIDFVEALNDSLTSGESLPFVGSQVKRGKTKRILDIKNKIKNNEEITQEELNYFNKYRNREYEKQLRGYTTGGEIGANWLPSMLAFGGEIAVGGWILKGLGLAGKGIGVGSNLAKTLLKSGKVNKAVAGALGFTSGQIAEGGLNALVGGSVAGLTGGFWANYNERKLNDTMKITDRGTVVFREASETPAKAFIKSMASLYISYFAESMGSLLGAPFKAGSKLIGNTSAQAFKKVLENCPKLEGFIKKSAPLLAKAYEKLNNLPIKGKSAEWLKNQVKFDGFLEEIGEELLEDVLNLTAGINNEERSLENYIKIFHKTPEEWAVLTGMIALQGTTLSVAGNLVGHIMQNNGVEDEKILETLSNTSEAERLEIIGEAIENGSLNVSEIESDESRAESFRQSMEQEAYDKFIAFGINEKQAAATAMLHGVQAMNLLKEGNSEEDIRKQLSFELSNKTVEEMTKGAQALNQKDFVGIAGANENEVEDAQREWQEKGTESKYFKKWFGESKVVDEAGKPLVVYHGSNFDFNEFSKNKVGSNYKHDKKGFFFTSDKYEADIYGETAQYRQNAGQQKTYSTYLSIEKPYTLEDFAKSRDYSDVGNFIDRYGELIQIYDNYVADIIFEAEKNGNDGIIFTDPRDGYTLAVAFEPEQIKSVDNRGTFDAENPNIYYQGIKPIEIEKDAVPEFEKISQLKKWIEKELNLLGEVQIKDNNKIVQFSKSNISRSLKGISRNKVQKQSYSKLKELVENAVFTMSKEADDRHKERNKGQDIYHNAFIYDGKTYGIEIAFDIPKSDNSLGSYAGHKIKIIKTPEVNEVSSKEGLLDLTGANISINDVRGVFNPDIKKHEDILFQPAYHGSRVRGIEKTGFDLSYALSGEGAMAHGYGVYLAENRDVSEEYRKALSDIKHNKIRYNGNSIEELEANFKTGFVKKYLFKNYKLSNEQRIEFLEEQLADKEKWLEIYKNDKNTKRVKDYKKYVEEYKHDLNLMKQIDDSKFIYPSTGQLYEVDIPENDVLLDEDKPLNEQSEKVKKAILEYYKSRPDDYIAPKDANSLGGQTGKQFYDEVAFQLQRENSLKSSPVKNYNSEREASLLLNSLGIKGITYDDRQDGRCYVIFDDKAVKVLNTFYQENFTQNDERLIAGFTAPEIFERLQALEVEYGDFTDNTPKEIIDNHAIKIQVLSDALEYMFKENRIQKDFDEIAYNTFHVMNNAPLPEAFVEANKNTQRTIRDYEELVKAKKEKKENEYLGYYTNQDNKNIIGLSEIADVSTLPHELAHLYLNAMNELAKTNAKTKERLDEVNNWLGYDGNSYTVAQQEKFAVGYEAYLYNGKAPNSILKEVFENFKEWLKSTYTYIRTQNIEFSAEAEAIFDKMFGADDFIEKQKASEDLLKRIKSKDVSKKKKANIEKEEKPSEYSEKYKNTAYAILETATGKSKKYLKSILETESNTQSTAKKREKLLREVDEVGDNITVNGFDPSWGEFFNFKANEDYTLAKEAFDVILNKTYLSKDKLSLYENDYAESIRDSIDETDIEYKKLLSAYRKGNRDVALATYYDWIETINPEIKRDYEERFYNDSRNIDKIENQSDIARAKEKIIKRAFEVENRYGINSDTGYVEMVKQTLGSLKFLTPVDKARIATNILDVSSLDMLLGRVDSVLDIAKTMQDVSYRNKLSQDIHKELQLTKNIKKGARTVGKYDYKTNKIFEQLREIDRLTPEQAQELKHNMADIIRRKEEGELSYEDILINKFIKYKADGRTYADSELMKSIYDEILKIKLIGKTAKNEQELQDKLTGAKEIEELTNIVSKKKKGNWIIKTYIQTMGNFETLMQSFFNKKVAQEYADELLYAETEAQVFQNEQKQKFQKAVAKIYNLPLWNFDKKIIEFLGTKFEYDEYRREYDKDKNLIKTQTFKKELTKMDLILAFMWSRNDTLEARLINQFGQQQLDDMIGKLDNKDIQFANLMMSTAQSFYPLVNQAYIKKYGFDLPRVSCYFPSTPERGTELDMFNDYGARSKNDSFSKQRAASEIVPMEFGNPVAILYNHIDGVAKFAIIGTQIDKANTILNNQTFLKPAIINTYGKDAYRTLQQTLLNVTYKAESQVYNGFSKVINTLTSNWIQANIAFKPLVAIKQFISANNYASIMPAGEWTLRFSQSALDWKKTVEYMWKIPYVRARYQGSYTNEFLQSTIENSAFAVTGKLKDFMALNVKLGDLGSLVFGGKPYIDYLISQGKTEQEAIKQFVIETNKMQQSSAVSSLSNFQVWASRQPLARPFTAYRNSQQQYARKCGDAIIQYCNGDISKGEMCKTIFHFMFLQPFVFALFTSGSLVTLAMIGDDDDLKEDIILSLSNLCIDSVPILHDMYLHAMKKFVLKDWSPVTTLPLWGDIEKEMTRLAKEDVPLKDYMHSLGYILGNVGTGVSITTVENTLGGIADIITDDWLKGVLRVIGYSDTRAGKMTGNEKKKKKRKYTRKEK